ncbi:MAG TPA: hypothetical protein VEW48_04400 [Thermoanaerobaculia bacterium]|nr:hypothetical protein [Thermoanaerobaculia bacterium]
MSRKRILKKHQKRQESVLAQLEQLYLGDAADEFLALAAGELKDPAASPLAAEWAEMADRALRQSLARADLGRIERLLPSLRRGGPLRPVAVLAEAVLDLAAGRLEAARFRLDVLAGMGSSAAAVPQELLTGLQSLARDGLPVLDTRDDPYLRATRELSDALRSLDRQDLARSLEAVRAAAPEDAGELRLLLDGVHRCLSLLADLAVVEDKLVRLPQSDQARASQVVAGWLRGPGPLLTAVLTATSAPSLLAPLHHAVRMRWRAVLERVAAREGPPGLAALCAADPKLLASDVSVPGGMQAGLASLRQGTQARQLLAAGRYANLVHLLRTRGLAEAESANLAVLWSLELWTINHRSKEDEPEEGWFLGLNLSEPPPHRALVRLQEMAGEIARRFPAGQQAEVARALRGELFDLCEQIHLCEHMARAALSLLEHLPGDVGLRILGVAGAISGEDSRTLRAIEARLAQGGKAQADDQAVAQRLMTQVGRETPETVARALDLLKPLFDDTQWPAVAALVAREMGARFADALNESGFVALENRRSGSRALAEVRRHLDRLQPVLAGTPGFAAMELAFDCWQQDRSPVEKRVKAFLRASPGLEGVLAAFLILDRATDGSLAPRGVATALHAVAHALIDLLDERWQIWEAAVPALVMAVRGRHLQRLEEKIRQLLTSPRLPAAGREALDQALRAVQTARNARAGRAPIPDPPPQAEPKPKKPRRRRSGSPQLGLHFF